MRTTFDITDELLRKAKRRAADDGVALRDIVESALNLYLGARSKRTGYRLRWTPDRGALQPGVDLDDRAALLDVMDGRR